MKRALLVAALCLVAAFIVSAPSASASVPGGYALYLPFDDGLNPTANPAAPAYPGTVVGLPAYTTDMPFVDGNVHALSFDGVDDYVTVPSYAALEPTGGFSVSLWAKSADPGSGNRYLIVKGAQGNLAGTYSLYTAGGNLYFDVFDYLGGSPPWYYAATTPATGVWDGTWHNIVGVFTGSEIRLYIDGALRGIGSVSFSPDFGLAQDALTIGDYNPLNSPGLYNYTGLLDEVLFYGRALDTWEVATLWDRHAVQSAKVGGAIVAHDPATITSATDKGEPDYALEGTIYRGAHGTLWGSIEVNYKSSMEGVLPVTPQTCTFTVDGQTTLQFYTAANPDRVDISYLLSSCDAGRYTVQLMERGDSSLPRGGVFVSKFPTPDYTLSSPYELEGVLPTLPYDWYLPLDRGNVVFWNAG